MVGQGDDGDGDGEQDQALEMVVQGALQAGGGLLHLPRWGAVAGGSGVAGGEVAVREGGEEDELGGLQEGGEGEGGEFGGHGEAP